MTIFNISLAVQKARRSPQSAPCLQPGARRRENPALRKATLCGLTALTTVAAAALPAGPLSLRMKFKPGEISRYRMSVLVMTQVPGMNNSPDAGYNVSADLIEQIQVTHALSNGGGELAVSTVSGNGIINGQPFTSPPTPHPALISFDARGNVTGAKDLPTSASVPMLANVFGSGALSMQGVYLPIKPVKPGDSWTQKVKITGITGGSLATVKATLVRLEPVGRFRTARIHAVLSTPLNTRLDAHLQPTDRASSTVMTLTGQFSIIYDSNFALDEGKVVRSAGNGSASILIRQITKQPATGHPLKPGSPPAHMTMKIRMGNNLIL